MKQEINPEDIRKGDLIRCEYVKDIGHTRAEEYTARKDGECSGYYARYYLLDRPKTREERAAYHLAGILATIRQRKTGAPAWYSVDDAAEALASLREWEAKNK